MRDELQKALAIADPAERLAALKALIGQEARTVNMLNSIGLDGSVGAIGAMGNARMRGRPMC